MSKLKSIVVLMTLLAVSGALAQVAAERPSGEERIEDATLTAQVKAVLAQDEKVKARQIEVETRDGVVQLSGFVDSEEMEAAALESARTVEGVREVRNDLVVRGADRSAGQVVDDTVIAARVKAKLGDSELAEAGDVNVEVNNGVVQLSGFVSSLEEKNRAADVASGVEGVRDVRNNIALAQSRQD